MSARPRGGGVAQRAPQVGDLDPRLLAPAGRLLLAEIAFEHEVPHGAARCRGCGWWVGGGQRVCPSRALARCVKDKRAVPAWLVHLVDAVPGATAPRVAASAAERHATDDALPGLFEAPERVDPKEARR